MKKIACSALCVLFIVSTAFIGVIIADVFISAYLAIKK